MKLFKEIRERKGIALIMALWIMTILLVVAASFAFMMRTEVKMAKNYRDGMKAHYLALAGVDHAIAMIQNDGGDVDHLYEAWFTTFATGFDHVNVTWDERVFTFGDGTYAVNLSDENSKYNLNYPNRSGLKFLVSLDQGSNPSVIWQGKICGIKDYVDSDEDVQDWGGTDRGYEGTGVENKPFDTVYEIQKVRGYTAGGGYGIIKINDGFWAGGKIYDNPLDPPSVGSRGQQSDMTVYSQDQNTQVDGSPRIEIKDAGQTTFEEDIGFPPDEASAIATASDKFADYPDPYPWMTEDIDDWQGIGAPGWYDPPGKVNLEVDVNIPSMILAADKMTAGNYDSGIIKGAININTATLYGLRGLLMIDVVKGQAIIDTRLRQADGGITCKGPDGEIGGGDDDYLENIELPDTTPPYTGDPRGTPYFANRGEIMMVDPGGGLPTIKRYDFCFFGDIVTVRTNRFRIYSTGKVGIDGNSDGDLEDSVDTVFASRKIEAVVDRDGDQNGTPGDIKVLYWSEKVFAD